MRIRPGNSDSGGVLLITMIIAIIMGVAVCSYLTLLSSRNKIVARSAAWNTAIPTLEEGLEEALAHMQFDSTPTANGWTTTNVSGWVGYWKQRTNSDGSYFLTTIYDYSSNQPTIYSAGFVPAPLASGYISRLVRAYATNPPSFRKNIAAQGQVTLSGSGQVDGYDSSLGPPSTNNINSAGGIITDSTASKGINVGTATVIGTAATGPGGTVSVGGGSVGDVTWTNSGIEPGWTNNNVNVSYPTNSPPTGAFFSPMTLVGTNATFLASQQYKVSSFTSSDSTKPLVVTGHATLWVTGNFTVSGSGYVYIAPNASLTLYIGGTGTVSGGGVVNATGLPADFSLIGLSSCTTLTYSGSSDLIGTVNAPNADVTISGGANVDGAMICNTATISGSGSLHYDVSLGSRKNIVITSWVEL